MKPKPTAKKAAKKKAKRIWIMAYEGKLDIDEGVLGEWRTEKPLSCDMYRKQPMSNGHWRNYGFIEFIEVRPTKKGRRR